MKTLFFGTPALAVPYLETLHRHSQVQAVITSPDQPAGRGYELRMPEVKRAAERLGLHYLQPESVKTPEFKTQIKSFKADVAIVVAYGKLIPPDVLALTRQGFLNVHFSLLPAYRGAAPIQWALINGEKETGVSLFWLDAGMDTGPLFLQKKIAIGEHDDAEALRQKLIPLGIEAMEEGLNELTAERKRSEPQMGTVSAAPILKKEDGHLNWAQNAQALYNRFRGLTPWPGVFSFIAQGNAKTRLKVLHMRPTVSTRSGRPGEIVQIEHGKSFVVRCSEGALEITGVQPEGKKPMTAWAWWQGAQLKVGAQLD